MEMTNKPGHLMWIDSPMLSVKFKKIHEDAMIPFYSKEGDNGLDLTAISCDWDEEKQRYYYDTGLAVQIPQGYVGLVYPRSSICKYDLTLTNSVGVIDTNFRGSIKFYFKPHNYVSPKIYEVGDRIGQLIITPCPKIHVLEVTELSSTDRNDQGFGSSGI